MHRAWWCSQPHPHPHPRPHPNPNPNPNPDPNQGYFVFYAALFVYVLYARRQVENGFFMQQSISTAFVDEAFGDYNEKTFEDVATAEEAFDWMAGPLSDGLFPDELYNGLEVPADKP